MFDNFLEESYHPWDKIYTNSETGNCLYLGDVQSALDIEFLQTHNIKTGKYRSIQLSQLPKIWTI